MATRAKKATAKKKSSSRATSKTVAKTKAAKTVAKKVTAKKASVKKAPTKKASGKAAPAASTAGAAARIDKMIADLGDWRGTLLSQVRSLIHEVAPDVIEEWKWRGAPVWSRQGMLAVGNAHKGKVKLTFFHGAQLRDPGKVFNNGLDGNKWRAIDMDEGYKLNKSAFKRLLQEAVAYNASHSVPKSKGSKA